MKGEGGQTRGLWLVTLSLSKKQYCHFFFYKLFFSSFIHKHKLQDVFDVLFERQERACLHSQGNKGRTEQKQQLLTICYRKLIPRACPPSPLTLLVSLLMTSSLVNVLLLRRDSRSCLLNFLLVLFNFSFIF